MLTGLHTVASINRTAGAGGHVTYDVVFRTSSGDLRQWLFRGNVFGGPVLMTTKSQDGRTSTAVIEEPGRYGEFATERWVHAFLRDGSEPAHDSDAPRRSTG
jgi:hypothetical protein